MKKKKAENKQEVKRQIDEPGTLKKRGVKELIAPAGIDASHIDHLEIISNVTRFARSFFVSSLPRM